MLILVEGPDCAGKSTIIERIVRQIALATHDEPSWILHKGPPTRHPIVEYELELLTWNPAAHVVADRWHLGEVVYPAIMDRESKLDRAALSHIELFLAKCGALLVHCNRGQWKLRECIQSRGDDYVTVDQVGALRQGFIESVSASLLPSVTLDVDRGVTDGDVARVVRLARYHQRMTAPLQQFVTYVGGPRPNVLLLGDVRKGHQDAVLPGLDPADVPAFVPFSATSGHYLFTHLGPLTRNQLGVANACDVDDVDALWDTLGRPYVVAMGTRAHRVVQRSRVSNFHHVQHPQYRRRFLHDQGAQYRDAIFNRQLAVAAK